MLIKENIPRKIRKYKSNLIFRITIVYLGLTLINLLVFWAVSGARQMQLITEKSLLESELSAQRLELLFEPSVILGKFNAFGNNKLVNKKEYENAVNLASELYGKTNFFKAGIPFTLTDRKGIFLNGGNRQKSSDKQDIIEKAFKARTLQNITYILETNPEKNTLCIIMPIFWSNDSGVALVIETIIPGVREEYGSLYKFAALLVMVVFIIQGVFGIYLYRTVLKPIQKLGDGARSVSEGQYITFIMPPKHKDEIRELIERFNQMTSSLAEKTQQLQSTIKVLRQRDTTHQIEMQLAQGIQAGLIPSTELAKPAFRVAVAFKPLQSVSGDFYDFFTLPSGAQGLLIADASGHGVPAAFVTLMASVFFEEAVAKTDNPAQVFAEVNREIEKAITTPDYLTAFYLVRQPDGKTAYCNACHRPAIVQKQATGELEYLTTDGFFIGSMYPPPYEYETCYTTLEKGDRIILYTDGITEAENTAKEAFGESRLVSLIKEHRTDDIGTLKEIIVKEVEEYALERQLFDDYALIIAQVN